ncbi:uncharacterized protein DDB_G0286591-like [Aphidius gifuensis]|nr:uncharacterized protein DDB_G0286591-like [Aphidius gifuensis]
MNTINDFHRIPLAITGKNVEVHQVPLKVKKQIVDNDDKIANEQPKQIQVVAQVHDIPVAQNEKIVQKSTTPIQAFRNTNVFQGKSSTQKISDDIIEQIISQDDDDDDNDDYNDIHDDMVNDINQENISTPIQAFRKTNIFDKKKSNAVDDIDSISPDIDSCQDTPNLSLTPIQAFRKTNIFNKKPLENDKTTTANNSLLSQQLSPIPKQILSGIDDSTPWRPCLVPRQVSFSKVQNIVQSTPQNKNLPEFINKLIKTNADNKKIMKNKKKISENNENSNVIMMNNIIQKKKLSNSSKSPRKFGTEISNLSGSISESSLSNGQSIIDAITTTPTKTVTTAATEKEKEIIPDESITSPSIPIVNANIEYDDDLDENSENKENEITDSPKKLSPSKKNRLLIDSPRRSFGKPLSKLSVSPVKLNFGNDEPQPGPSGLVKRQPLAERRITRQSNLHMFLNLPELPESTKITTADGIFDDINSNPSNRGKKIKNFKDPKMNNGVDDTDHSYDLEGQENQLRNYHPMLNNKRPKKQSNLHLLLDDSDDDTENQIPHGTSGDVEQSNDIGEPPIDFDDGKTLNNSDDELNVNNLFGFCDDIGDESNITATHDNTSTKTVKKINKKTTKKIGKPVIVADKPMTTRYSIIKDKKILDNEANEQPKMNKVDAIKAHFGSTKNAVIEAHDFSDTFDFGELEQPDDVSQVPLFVDLEPVHFKQPPRYSYNRKRHLNTSGETDDDEDNNDKIPESKITKKKKKISKEEREQKKQLENWAKSLNQSFNEVDEFDLIVESVND